MLNKKVLLGFSIGALFLYLTLRQIDFKSSWYYIQNASWLYIFVILFVYSAAFMVRSIRWKYLLAPLVQFPAKRLFSFLILGFFMNNLLPLRLGELVRAHVTGQKTGVSRSGALATIVIERLFDGLSYITLFLITILFLPFPEWAKKSLFAACIVFTGVLVFLFFLGRHQELVAKVFPRLPFPEKITKKLQYIFVNFASGLKILSDVRTVAKVYLLALVVWGIEGSVFYLVGQSFHMDLNYFQGVLVMIIIGTGAILPTAPGYVGTVEFLGVTALSFLGVDKNQAFGYILTLHAIQLVVITAWGIRSMIVEKLTLSELIRIEKSEAAPGGK